MPLTWSEVARRNANFIAAETVFVPQLVYQRAAMDGADVFDFTLLTLRERSTIGLKGLTDLLSSLSTT
jgi:hypothetical protein